MTAAYAILSVLAGALFGLLAAAESGLLWGAATYAVSGSLSLLGFAYLIAVTRPRNGDRCKPRPA